MGPPQQRAPEPQLGVLSTWGGICRSHGKPGTGFPLVSHWFHWEEGILWTGFRFRRAEPKAWLFAFPLPLIFPPSWCCAFLASPGREGEL